MKVLSTEVFNMESKRDLSMNGMISEKQLECIVQLRKTLHEHPEKSMQEEKTKRILMDFLKIHATNMQIVDRKGWFYALKKGSGTEKPIAFRADFDAVTCADGNPRHLCGHDGHSAILAGFALWLNTADLDRDVYLIFQPGEESGEGGSACSELIEEKQIAEIYGFHNIPGYDCGTVLLLPHTFACASTGLEIHFEGKQTHAAYPENGVNPANAIAQTILDMNAMIREPHKGIVLGTVIGVELGSRSYGVAAGAGTLRLTLRAEYQDEYDAFVNQVEATAKKLAAESGLTVAIQRIEEFPATINDAACVAKVQKAAERLSRKVAHPEEPFRWSEDFGYYLQKTKGAFMGIGCGKNHAALHTMEYEFEDGIIESVIELYREILML